MINKKLTKTLLLMLAVCFFSSTLQAQENISPSNPETFKEKKEKEGYVLNLKELIKKSKRKMEQVNQKLQDQAKERRNQQREEKAREYYEKATRLYEEGKYDAAKALWEKAIRITEHEEMEDYISLSLLRQNRKEKALQEAEERRIKRLEIERGYTAKEVERKYEEAISNYKKRKYLAAKVAFEEVNLMFPSHKATDSYLALINANIEEDQREMIEAKVKEGPVSDSAADKAAWKKELERREKERRRHLEEQAEQLYEEAVQLYKNKNLAEAKQKFKEIEWILPDYKKTVKYLIKIDKFIEKYGIEYTEKEKEEFQRKKMQELKVADMKYEQKKKEQEDSPWFWPFGSKDVTDFNEDKAENLYEDAVAFYKKEYFPQARDKFLEVQDIYPGYKNTEKYLEKIYKALPKGFTPDGKPVRNQPTFQNVEQKDITFEAGSSVAQAIKERQKLLSTKAEGKYKEAVDFYKQGNFREAKNKFIEVEALSSGYESTRDYLMRIDDDILFQKENGIVPSAVSKTPSESDDKGFLEKILPFTGSDQNEKGIKDQKEIFYEQAIRFYDDKQYVQAKHRFTEVNRLDRGYKRTEKYLRKIEKQLVKERKRLQEQHAQIVSDKTSTESVKKTKKKKQDKKKQAPLMAAVPKVDQALEKMIEDKAPIKEEAKEKVDKQAIDTSGLTKKQRKKLAKNQKVIERLKDDNSDENRKRLRKVLKEAYEDGIKMFKANQFHEAKVKFSTIESLSPGYKRAKDYVKRSDEMIYKQSLGLTRRKVDPQARERRVKEVAKEIYQDPDLARADSFKTMVSREQFAMVKEQKQAQEDRLREIARQERLQRNEEERYLKTQEKMELEAIREQREIEIKRRQKAEELAQRRAKQEAERLAKREAKLKAKRRRHEIKKLKRELKELYKEGLDLYEDKKIAEAKEKFDMFEKMIADPKLTESYRLRMKNKLKKSRLDIQEQINKEMQEESRYAQQKEIETEQKREKIKVQTKNEIEEIQRKIRMEEDRLAREREYERKRLEKVEKKREDIVKEYVEKISEVKSEEKGIEKNSEKNATNDLIQEVSKRSSKSVEQQQKDLEELVKIRQKELDRERIRIRREFKENIEKLYQRAVRMYKKGLAAEASRMFLEIDSMEPGYKKTEKYLSDLRQDFGQQMVEDPYQFTYNIETKNQTQSPKRKQIKRPEVNSRLDVIENSLNEVEKSLR